MTFKTHNLRDKDKAQKTEWMETKKGQQAIKTSKT